MSLPLEGIKVVDLSNYVAAPSAARMLSDLGAEVIKIETFDGDPWRKTGKAIIKRGDEENPIYDVFNVGKSSICVNIKNPKGLELVLKMIGEADVFITNTRAQSLRKLGLDSDTLHAKFPRLIYGTINGYGDKGPDANTPGFDSMAFWTRSGFLLDMSEANLNKYPVCTPTAIGDCVSGIILVAGIMTALYNREKTGEGEVIKTALFGAATWVMCNMIIQAQAKYEKEFPLTRDMEGALTSKYMCKDGKWFLLNALDYARDAQKVYDILGVSDEIVSIGVVDYMTKAEHNSEVSAIFQREFLKKDCAEWAKIFKDADIVSGQMAHFRDVNTDEQAWANGFLEEYLCRSGETCVMPRTPIRLESVEMAPAKQASMPGDETDEVLSKFGYSEAEIAEMHTCGAVQ